MQNKPTVFPSEEKDVLIKTEAMKYYRTPSGRIRVTKEVTQFGVGFRENNVYYSTEIL